MVEMSSDFERLNKKQSRIPPFAVRLEALCLSVQQIIKLFK